MKLTIFGVLILCLAINVDFSVCDSRAVPVQMDMKSRNDITICTGNKRTINCREGANMAITTAFWGRLSDKTCPSDDGDPVTDCDASPDTLALIRKKCEGKRECDLTAKHNLLQNAGSSHCPGVNKYLVINYTCMPESKGVTVCDSTQTKLWCDAGWVMQLADVFWGRRASSSVCGLVEGLECDVSEGATKYLRKKCNGKKNCLVQADGDVLDTATSPCQNTQKYLLVNYICSPPAQRDESTTEDESKPIKETSSKELMGMLEKHITEIKGKEIETASLQAKPQLSLAPITSPVFNVAANVPISGGSSVNTPAQATGTVRTNKNEEETTEKKSSKVNPKGSVEGPPTIDDSSVDTSSVRSILSRAKNILKTLDIDQSDVRKKRFKIARPDKKLQAKQKQKKFKISKHVNNKRSKYQQQQTQQQHYDYPNNFLLRSWYGF